jgi:hypothetical protein
MPINQIATVIKAFRGLVTGEFSEASLDPSGALVVVSFYQKALLDGRGFSVQAGTISAPVTGDGTAITDTAAEMAVDVAVGHVIIPMVSRTTIHAPTADLGEGATKSVATVSSSGTAFVPLPLNSGGVPAVSTARVQATGAVTVTAEVVTTTVPHFTWHQNQGATPATDIITELNHQWMPVAGPILNGPRSLYLQVALSTYMAAIEYLEFTSAQLRQ